MKLKYLEKVVEEKIHELLRIFNENPTFFLSERDVQCFLYSLLIRDSVISRYHPIFKRKNLKERTKTILVHTEKLREREDRKENYDVSIWQRKKIVSLDEWEPLIGIEIKFNRGPYKTKRGTPSSVEKDITKLSRLKKGYLLWLNWNKKRIKPEYIEALKKHLKRKKYKNIKVYCLDYYKSMKKVIDSREIKDIEV